VHRLHHFRNLLERHLVLADECRDDVGHIDQQIGLRAAVAWTPEIAALAREHNDANVLVLPARFVGTEDGKAILKAWLETPFAGGRHARRIAKIERDAATDTSTEESR
jgi:ribose 5-phosphate isomerase RpiB